LTLLHWLFLAPKFDRGNLCVVGSCWEIVELVAAFCAPRQLVFCVISALSLLDPRMSGKILVTKPPWQAGHLL